jgi:hypothetical protein
MNAAAPRHGLLATLLLGLAACQPQDPVDPAGTWRPTGINARNLAAQLVNPTDLTLGAAADGSRGSAASPAVTRLVTGTRPALPNPRSATPAPYVPYPVTAGAAAPGAPPAAR